MTYRNSVKTPVAIAALLGGAMALSACGDSGFLGTGIGASDTRTNSASATRTDATVNPGNTDRMMDGNAVRYADGSIRHTDGTVYYGNGLVLYPDGTTASLQRQPGAAPNPAPGQGPAGRTDSRGSIGNKSGTMSGTEGARYGSILYGDGSIQHPDGTIYYGDGRVRYPDGRTQTLEQRPGSANPAPGQGPAGRTDGRVRG